MASKKEVKTSKNSSSSQRNKDEEKALKEHPFESMSQVQNRYGKGRKHGGSDGTHQDGRGSNH